MRHCDSCSCDRDDRARYLIGHLVARYGSVSGAGWAYSERYGLYRGRPSGHRSSTGARLFERVLNQEGSITATTLDRIEVFAAS